jgi:hypothetical protein
MGAAAASCVAGAVVACSLACHHSLPDGIHRAGVCAAMHLAAQHIFAAWNVCSLCPGSPLGGHGAWGSQAICAVGMGVLLFHVSHSEGAPLGGYSTLQFYASHAWGLLMAEAVRAAVYAPALKLWLPC